MVESIKKLRKICKLDTETDPTEVIYGKWTEPTHPLYEKMSMYITRLLLHTNITPNQVTILNMLLGVIAGMFFVPGQYLYSFIGALLLQLWRIMDYVDGQIARYRKTASITGAYMDVLNHIIITPIFFICMSFGFYRMYHNPIVFVFGFLASFSILLIDYVTNIKYEIVAHTYEVFQFRQSVKKLKEAFPKTSPVNPSFKNKIPIRVHRIAEIIFYLAKIPGIIHVILLSSMIDLIISFILTDALMFNTLYAVLIVYGITVPIIWIGICYLNIKNKLPDGLYHSLFISKK